MQDREVVDLRRPHPGSALDGSGSAGPLRHHGLRALSGGGRKAPGQAEAEGQAESRAGTEAADTVPSKPPMLSEHAAGSDRSPRLRRRPLARRAGARGHADLVLGHDLLHAGADRAADRGRARLVDVVRHGRLLGGAFGGRADRALCRALDRPLRRSRDDDDRLADRRARPGADRARRASRGLSRRLDGARRRHVDEPLRFRLRHASAASSAQPRAGRSPR